MRLGGVEGARPWHFLSRRNPDFQTYQPTEDCHLDGTDVVEYTKVEQS